MDFWRFLLLVGTIAAVWWACQPAYLFEVRIHAGQPRVTKGRVTAAFLQQIRESCAREAVASGRIRGIRRGKRVRLQFSADIPATCQQQLRNAWPLCR